VKRRVVEHWTLTLLIQEAIDAGMVSDCALWCYENTTMFYSMLVARDFIIYMQCKKPYANNAYSQALLHA